MIDAYSERTGAVEQAFRQGHGIAVPWGEASGNGDLAEFYRSRGFVTGGEGGPRFHTLPELEARAAGI